MTRRATPSKAKVEPVDGAPPQPREPSDDGIYWEFKVADALGLARDRVAAIRAEHFKDGVHFRLVRGEVVLTELGLARLHEIASAEGGTAPSSPGPATAKFPVPAGPPQRARFEVVKVMTNRRLLSCVPAADRTARAVLVHVKDNSNFMARMVFEAMEAEHGTWQFRGRLPRKRGKW